MDHPDDGIDAEAHDVEDGIDAETEAELDAELRNLFTSDRLDVPVRADAEEIIVSGARQVRRRRIVAATASGALGVVAAVVAGFVLAGGTPDAMPPATSTTTTRPPVGPSIEVTSLPGEATAEAPPLGTTTTTPSPPPHTKTKTKTSSSVSGPPTLNYEVIGPTGIRGLRLGQTLEEAQATGLLSPTAEESRGCQVYEMVSDDRLTGRVYVNGGTVQIIDANPVQTPQGVGPGWTLAQVHEVYGDFTDTGPDSLIAVPGNPYAHFHLRFVDGKVVSIGLLLTYDQPCF